MRFPKEMNAQSEFGLSNLKRGLAVFSHIRLLAGGCWCLCCVLPVICGAIYRGGEGGDAKGVAASRDESKRT